MIIVEESGLPNETCVILVSYNECGVGVMAGAPAKDAVNDRAQTPVCAQGRACEYE